MDFKKAGILGSYISKDYAEDMFRLLATYRDISASEAASRLDLHIKTVQDFLEAMFSLGIIDKNEVSESKRPHFRYSLVKRSIEMVIDLGPFFKFGESDNDLSVRIRESINAGARFSVSRNKQYISSVHIGTGEGRSRQERKINLTIPQGKFLYHLPFPGAQPQRIDEIMQHAGVGREHKKEVIDIVEEFIRLDVIERDRE